MRSKNKMAAVALTCASLMLGVAAPAYADPIVVSGSQTDQAFLQFLKDKGLTLKTDATAIDLAHSTCDVLSKTGSVQKALEHVKDATKWTDINKIGNFGGASVQAYCPKAMPAT